MTFLIVRIVLRRLPEVLIGFILSALPLDKPVVSPEIKIVVISNLD
jgi:hypothetical protein